MTGARPRLLRNPGLIQAGGDLELHLETWLSSCRPADLISLLDEVSVSLLRDAFLSIGGCEGTVWLADPDEENLVAVYNSGSESAKLIGFEQPVGTGIISMVYAQQQPYCENDIGGSDGHDDTLDRKIAKKTTAMIAVPFYFALGLRGVISCVQLAESDTGSEGFSSGNVQTLARTSNVIERLINETLLSTALGLGDGG